MGLSISLERSTVLRLKMWPRNGIRCSRYEAAWKAGNCVYCNWIGHSSGHCGTAGNPADCLRVVPTGSVQLFNFNLLWNFHEIGTGNDRATGKSSEWKHGQCGQDCEVRHIKNQHWWCLQMDLSWQDGKRGVNAPIICTRLTPGGQETWRTVWTDLVSWFHSGEDEACGQACGGKINVFYWISYNKGILAQQLPYFSASLWVHDT